MTGRPPDLRKVHREIVDALQPVLEASVDSETKFSIMSDVRDRLETIKSQAEELDGGSKVAELVRAVDDRTYQVEAMKIDLSNRVHQEAVDGLAAAVEELGAALP